MAVEGSRRRTEASTCAYAMVVTAATLGLLSWLLLTSDAVPSNPSHSGWSAEWLGDCNGDGVPEILLVTPVEPAVGGRARILCGVTRAVLHTLDGVGAPLWGERRTHAAGDVDGDGRADLMLQDERGVRMLSGASLRTLFEREAHPAAAPCGDLNTDGCADWILADPDDDSGGRNAGRVLLLSGGDGSVLHEHLGQPGDGAGANVAGLGDTDGDGIGDIGVVCFRRDRWPHVGVKVLSGRTGTLLLEFEYPFSVKVPELASAGDVDGDGLADLLLASRGGPGILDVHSGRSGESLYELDLGPGGLAFEGIGDLDRDGRDDIAASSGGELVVFSGASGAILRRIEGATLGLGRCDLDGDGRAELLITRSVKGPARAEELWDQGRLEVLSGRDGGVLLRFDAAQLR